MASGGKHFVQCLFVNVQYFFFYFVNLIEDVFAFFQFEVFHACFQFFYFGALFGSRFEDVDLQFLSLGARKPSLSSLATSG